MGVPCYAHSVNMLELEKRKTVLELTIYIEPSGVYDILNYILYYCSQLLTIVNIFPTVDTYVIFEIQDVKICVLYSI